MRTLNNFLICAFVLLGLVSCSSDDDNTNSVPVNAKNVMKYDGKDYPLKLGALGNWGSYSADDPTEFSLSLVTSEGKEVDGELEPKDSIYSGMSFDLYGPRNSKDLPVGTYTFNEDIERPFGFDYGECVTNYNYRTGPTEDGEYLEVISGKIEVLTNGNPYEIKVECTLENDKKVTAYFKGDFYYEEDFYDEDDYANHPQGAKAVSADSHRSKLLMHKK